MSFDRKRVFVTGGTSGIGFALGVELARRGAHLWICSQNGGAIHGALAAFRSAARHADQRIGGLVLDVSDRHAVFAAVDPVLEGLGGLDVLINNAGVATVGHVEVATSSDYERMMAVNYFGTVWVTRAFLPCLIAQSRGAICCVASSLGAMGLYGYTAYAASKFAVVGFAECLRQDLLRHGIDVSVVLPADVDTPQYRANRPHKPPETRALAGMANLLSPRSVAVAVLDGIDARRHRIEIGSTNRWILWLARIAPGLVRWFVDRKLRRFWKTAAVAAALLLLHHPLGARATPTGSSENASMPWERDITGVELLIVQPTIERVLFLQKRPDVRWPAPIEAAIGHVALRLVDDGPIDAQWAVGVSAYMDIDGDGVDDPSNVFRGLFGGYDKRLLVLPLDRFADSYAFEQARWIRRYVVPMREDEIAALQAELEHAWARSERRALGGYSFFTENCSTELTALLNAALWGRARELNYPFTLPRKYRRRGYVTPPVGTVTPQMAAEGSMEQNWAPYPALLRVCERGDVDCAETWAAEARTLGADWTDEMARWLRKKKRYRERFSDEVRELLAEPAGPPTETVDRFTSGRRVAAEVCCQLQGDAAFGPGARGQGFALDGSGDHVSAADSSELALSTFTLAAWIQVDPGALGSHGGVVGRIGSGAGPP